MHNWKKAVLGADATLKDAMHSLNKQIGRIVLILQNDGRLLGTITDGDIRRGLLRGLTLDDGVSEVMNHSPLVAFPAQTKESMHTILRQHSILAIPIIDNERRVVGLETIDSVEEKSHNNMDIVLMAGGFGKRLLPLTEHTPKPMLPLEGSKPMLQGIIEEFVRQGFCNIYISTHYKPDVIKNYFKDGQEFGCTINYTHEVEPLGTAGALSFLKDKIKKSFIVMNADLSVKINYMNLIDFHQTNGALATMCVRRADYQVPYGVVELEGLHIKKIQEKPCYTHFINAGIYCFSNNIFDYIGYDQYLDMPALFQKVIEDGQCVTAFPIHECWVDIGIIDQYKRILNSRIV